MSRASKAQAEPEPLVAVIKRDQIPQLPYQFDKKSVDIIKSMLAETLELIGFNEIKGASVIIKPNLVRPALRKLPGITTDLRVIIAACELFKDMGARTVMVGDNPGYGLSCREALNAGNAVELIKRTGAEVRFFDQEPQVTVANKEALLFKNIKVAKLILDADLLVNLPKMKTHVHTQVSLGMKNLQGIFSGEQRLFYHRNDLSQKIVDTVRVRMPDLNIIDGLWAMEGQAPFFGNQIADFGTIVASRDILAVDIISARLMGFHHSEIAHIMLALQQKLTDVDPAKIQTVGTPLEQVARHFIRPVVSSLGAYEHINVFEGGACLGCMSALRHSLDKMNFDQLFPKLGQLSIYLGKPMLGATSITDWSGDLWLVGNCALELTTCPIRDKREVGFVPGCPPHVLDFYKAVCLKYGLQSKDQEYDEIFR